MRLHVLSGPRRKAALTALLLTGLGITPLATGPSSADAAPAAPAAAAVAPSTSSSVGGVDLGPNTYVFTPDMRQADIQATVDAIAAQQVDSEFGDERYALLFEPGTYGTSEAPLNFQVGYYTEVAGLGQSPEDVVINGSVDVLNQCDNGNCIALNNFWRSLSNLSVNVTKSGPDGCHNTSMFWATSQAAPMRRTRINGPFSLMDYCTGPAYASGGFIADSVLSGSVINGSQQQFVVRNSQLGGWSNGVWNQVFVGTKGAPGDAPSSSDHYSTVATTPVEVEKPYLYVDGSGEAQVFVPSKQTGTSGPSWSSTTDTVGTSRPLSDFFVADPSDSASDINAALAGGQDLLLTPGQYDLAAPISVVGRDTVVLGLGLPTLRPTAGNQAFEVSAVPGVSLAGFVVDAGPVASRWLINLQGSSAPGSSDPADPTTLHDVYVRVGGAAPGKTKDAVRVAASDVVLDNTWIWRADHGAGVGWTENTAATGLRVLGSDVTAYGLFVEHFQGKQVYWKGADGTVQMFQSEMPYDVPSQAAWGPKGQPAIAFAQEADGFEGVGLGAYSFFNQGVPIRARWGFHVPADAEVHLRYPFTVFLDGGGQIAHVVNSQGGTVSASNSGTPSFLLEYP